MICMCPRCATAGTAWPTILIARLGAPDDLRPFRLELPRVACEEHQAAFIPDVFIPEIVREYLRWLASTWRGAEPDFTRLGVEWQTLDHPHFADIRTGNQARFLAPSMS